MSEGQAPPHDIEAEIAVLGSILLANPALPKVQGEGLRAEDFYRDKHRLIFQTMLELSDFGHGIDPVTLTGQLRESGSLQGAGGDDYVYGLVEGVPSIGHVRKYAQRIVKLSSLRETAMTAHSIQQAALGEDEQATKELVEHLISSGPPSKTTLNPLQWAEHLSNVIFNDKDEVWPLPWPTLNEHMFGGIRRKQYTVIGGHSSHGKSSVIDQILAHVAGHSKRAKRNLRIHLYVNEMSEEERGFRVISRMTRIPTEKLYSPDRLTDDEKGMVVNALNGLPFGVTDCSGWSAIDICRDIQRHKYDLVAVDLFHGIGGGNKVDELDHKSMLLKQFASRLNCHIVTAVHLNETRVKDIVRPAPMLGDIRGTGSIKNDANWVIFVHQEQDSATGEVLGYGRIRIAKARGGTLGSCKATFDGPTQTFTETETKTAEKQEELLPL